MGDCLTFVLTTTKTTTATTTTTTTTTLNLEARCSHLKEVVRERTEVEETETLAWELFPFCSEDQKRPF